MKIQQTLSSFSLRDVGIFLRDGPIKSDIGIVYCIHQKEHIRLHRSIKNNSIHIFVHILKNYRGFI